MRTPSLDAVGARETPFLVGIGLSGPATRPAPPTLPIGFRATGSSASAHFTHRFLRRTRFEDSDRLYQGSYRTIAPRLGFAYRVGGSSRTVLRGGYGIYYDPGVLDVTYNTGRVFPLYYNTTLSVSPDETNPANFLTITRDIAPAAGQPLQPPVNLNVYTQNEKTGTMHQWTLGVQHQFDQNTILDVTYIGWRAYHFMFDNVINLPKPGPGNPQAGRQYQPFGSGVADMSNNDSAYEGLNARFERRAGKGLTFLAGFSWGHVLGNGVTENGNALDGGFMQLYNVKSNWASLASDVRLRFVYSAVYNLPTPFGLHHGILYQLLSNWEAGGIYILQSGMPTTATAGGDPLNRGRLSTTYPNATGLPANLERSERTPQKWFNTAAFAAPPPYTFGNAGRFTIRVDRVNNVDLVLAKTVKIGESRRVQFRSEFFNLCNHPQFAKPDTDVNSATYGKVFSTYNQGRQIQFGLKFLF